ncbi:MAG: hypothetical protein QG632_556, partial [Candidatus Dependentiae bacterium]|nr:hypothetical protein [Candidatus Dependentiae bacterium]
MQEKYIRRPQVRLKKTQASISDYVKLYPAIFIAVTWIAAMIMFRFIVVSIIHQPGNPEFNPPVVTGLIGSVKWDGIYYLEIAKNGYDTSGSNSAFYPAYPLLLGAVSKLGMGFSAAAHIINAAALILAAQGVYLLSLLVTKKRRIALLAVLAWLAFPAAHFFIAFYTEALFSALVVWALYFLLRKQYIWAGVLAGLASGTRGTGVVLGAVILFQYLADKGWSWRKIDWQILAVPISFSGIAAYWLWIYSTTNVLPWVFFSGLYAKFWPYMRFEPNIIKTLYVEMLSMVKLINSTSWLDAWLSEWFTKLHFFVAWLAIAYSA